jgi:hypothetical protein
MAIAAAPLRTSCLGVRSRVGSDPSTRRLKGLSRVETGSDPSTRRLNPLSRVVTGV